jgi:uncharacterized membrane protein
LAGTAPAPDEVTEERDDRLRFLRDHGDLQSAFGDDAFGSVAERAANFFGSARYAVTQAGLIFFWIVINIAVLGLHWDPYPFVLLNLLFALQAAMAAPLILLAQSRQAQRDKAHDEAAAKHREALAARQAKARQEVADRQERLRSEIAEKQQRLLEENTDLTRQIAELSNEVERLTRAIHEQIAGGGR